jgi:hypothetical protein
MNSHLLANAAIYIGLLGFVLGSVILVHLISIQSSKYETNSNWTLGGSI